MMTLRALLEKSADVDMLREMVGFAAQRANALAELHRDTARLRLVEEQIAEIEGAGRDGLARADAGQDPAADMVRALSRVVGVGVETAELLAREILLRNLRALRANDDETSTRREFSLEGAEESSRGYAHQGYPVPRSERPRNGGRP
jgi:transposase